MKYFILYFFIIALNFSSFFAYSEQKSPIEEASSELIYKNLSKNNQKAKEKKKINIITSLQQISGFIVSADHISQFYMKGTYYFKDTWSTSIKQSVNRHYFLNPNSNDKGLWIKDTILSINKNFSFYKNSLSVGLSSTLPISHYSKVNSHLTTSSIYAYWSYPLLPLLNIKSKWLTGVSVFINPITSYYLSRYTTTPTNNQSLGGRPLPQFLIGIESMGLIFKMTDYFSLIGSYGRWLIMPYKTQYIKDNYQYEEHFYKHYYLFYVGGKVNINKNWNMSLSYSHVNRLDKRGRKEILLFDDRLSNWSISANYSISFNP